LKDYYKILEIVCSSTQEEVKKSYRKLAKQYHPDINPNPEAEVKFKLINEAYEIIGNETSRKQYDNTNLSYNGINLTDTTNIFDKFGFQKKKPKNKKKFISEDNISVLLTFEEAIKGVSNKTINHTYKVECNVCTGYGGKLTTCDSCDGIGTTLQTSGFVSINITCEICKGAGKYINEICQSCQSKGFNIKRETIDFNIPAGIDKNTILAMRGKGHKINNKRGDLFIKIDIDKSDTFRREQLNIIKTIEVKSLSILKQEILTVEGFDKTYNIKLKNAFHKKNFIFPNDGIKSINTDTYGDFIVEINVKFEELSPKQIEILKTL